MLLSDLTDQQGLFQFFFPKLSLHTLYCFVSYSLLVLGMISDDGCSTVLGSSLLVSRTGYGGQYRLW